MSELGFLLIGAFLGWTWVFFIEVFLDMVVSQHPKTNKVWGESDDR